MALGSRALGHLTLSSILLLLALPCVTFAQEPADYYQANCTSCHTIGGGPLVGPDLKDLEQRRDRAWMLKFLADPQALIDSGDPYAKKLLEESNGVVMPRVADLDRAQTEALLDWIAHESQSSAEESAPTEAVAEPVFTAADAALGRELALGSRKLTNGGPACISCHAFRGAPMLGGGTLGPDLTHELTKLGGGMAATAWLGSPPTPTMKSVYTAKKLTADEDHALAAYLDSLAQEQGGALRPAQRFLPIGLGGCLVALVAMDAIWKKRLRAVRRPLVRGKSGRTGKRE
jgi:mono/diheme cytochrome c family protein